MYITFLSTSYALRQLALLSCAVIPLAPPSIPPILSAAYFSSNANHGSLSKQPRSICDRSICLIFISQPDCHPGGSASNLQVYGACILVTYPECRNGILFLGVVLLPVPSFLTTTTRRRRDFPEAQSFESERGVSVLPVGLYVCFVPAQGQGWQRRAVRQSSEVTSAL